LAVVVAVVVDHGQDQLAVVAAEVRPEASKQWR
jgi:hypothetical protein